MSRSKEPTKNTVFKRRRPNFDFCTAPYVWKYVSETSLMHFSMEMNKITWFFSACAGLIWQSVELSECRVKWIFYTFQNLQSVELSECRVKWVTTVPFCVDFWGFQNMYQWHFAWKMFSKKSQFRTFTLQKRRVKLIKLIIFGSRIPKNCQNPPKSKTKHQ